MAKQANKHLTLRQIDFYTPKSDKTIQKKSNAILAYLKPSTLLYLAFLKINNP